MQVKNSYIILFLVVLGAFILTGWIGLLRTEKLLKSANKEIIELRLLSNKLIQDNNRIIDNYKNISLSIDSLVEKSNISNEKEVHHHWNTVYHELIINEESFDFISNYLYQLGHE